MAQAQRMLDRLGPGERQRVQPLGLSSNAEQSLLDQVFRNVWGETPGESKEEASDLTGIAGPLGLAVDDVVK